MRTQPRIGVMDLIPLVIGLLLMAFGFLVVGAHVGSVATHTKRPPPVSCWQYTGSNPCDCPQQGAVKP